MRRIRFVILPFLVATSLAAQAPPPTVGDSPPIAVVSPRRAALFDGAAFVDGHEPFGLDLGVADRVVVDPVIDKLERWEPGGPSAARRGPLAPVFVNVSWRFALVAVDDATPALASGTPRARLVAAIAVGW
jgi:hypothetical protein